MRRLLYFAMCLTVLNITIASSVHAEADKTKQIYEAALKAPFDDKVFGKYLAVLPKVQHPFMMEKQLYIVEGDMPMTAEKVRAYLISRRDTPAAPADSKPELVVHAINGQPQFWSDPARRTLRYAVARATFPDEATYNRAVAGMAAAGKEWEDLCTDCGLKFIHVKEHDGIKTAEEFQHLTETDELRFQVIYQDTHGLFIASAFFPSDPWDQRLVTLDPSYFRPGGYTGVLRHEIGHLLGYRHEHTRFVIDGCSFEDNDWKPLTPYDPHSVMHYFCGGRGRLDMNFTDVDRAGHRKLYLLKAAAPN